MVKFIKPGKVVIVLQGRYAGRKAVIVKNHDDGTKDRLYGYAVVAGVERYPLKITRSMGQKRITKRSKVKPFIKLVNYNHLMPTRGREMGLYWLLPEAYAIALYSATLLSWSNLRVWSPTKPSRSLLCGRTPKRILRGCSRRSTTAAKTSGFSPSSASNPVA
ncbi:ribosomal protein L27 [Endogone sp. FLAS-F59071]|nr:ribosomal protein L27 [Endogone sp. FLAS-F59071]|eukprot:RUS20942.1 ribosomal protein L27 [Endogone sp. FLAS-F59071]